mgnify:CR=1 FL=1
MTYENFLTCIQWEAEDCQSVRDRLKPPQKRNGRGKDQER